MRNENNLWIELLVCLLKRDESGYITLVRDWLYKNIVVVSIAHTFQKFLWFCHVLSLILMELLPRVYSYSCHTERFFDCMPIVIGFRNNSD
jgi:hypothetical protein